MSRNTGYIRAENLWRIENLDLVGTMSGCGNQIIVNRTDEGPVLKLGGNPSYNNDLFLIEKPDGTDVFRVDHLGKIWIQDRLVQQTIPALENKGIVYVQDCDLEANSDEFVWDFNNSRLGVGTCIPKNKIHLKDGDLNIENGDLLFDSKLTLNRKMCVLDATHGQSNIQEGLILGNPNLNNAWRVVVANGNLIFQKRIAGIWCTRGQFS